MANGIQNAGLLDGSAGWTGLSGAALSVDETVVGGPGRAVLKATRTLSVGQTVEAASSLQAVTAGQQLEAFALVAAGGTPSVAVEVLNVGGTRVGITSVPLVRLAESAPSRGLKDGFSLAYATLPAPAAGNARLVGTGTATAAGSQSVWLLKPYLAPKGARSPGRWDPGSHANVDLQRPIWPDVLPPFLADSGVEPFADRRGFSGDTNIPTTTRLYSGLHHAFRGLMRLTAAEADALVTFYEGGAEPFYVVRPDTDQLCLAEWLADGAPRPVQMKGAFAVYEVGLHLWPA